MKLLWKKWFSYIIPINLSKKNSIYSGELTLLYDKGELRLDTSKATYSHGLKYFALNRAFELIDFSSIHHVLSLGYGMGSISSLLRLYVPNCIMQIDAVEIDPEILSLVQAHSDTVPSIHYIHQDAYDYIHTCNKKYDLIVIDIFIHDSVPLHFDDYDFLNACKSCLIDNGYIIFNRLNTGILETKRNEKYFATIFQPLFNITSIHEIRNNCIMIGQKNLRYNKK